MKLRARKSSRRTPEANPEIVQGKVYEGQIVDVQNGFFTGKAFLCFNENGIWDTYFLESFEPEKRRYKSP